MANRQPAPHTLTTLPTPQAETYGLLTLFGGVKPNLAVFLAFLRALYASRHKPSQLFVFSFMGFACYMDLKFSLTNTRQVAQ